MSISRTLCRKCPAPFCLSNLFRAIAVALFILPHGAGAETLKLWMSPLDPVWRNIHHWQSNDYMELFKHDAPWPAVAHNIRVFDLSKRFVLNASDEELSTIIVNLKSRGIDLSMQGTPLVPTQECGMAVESYGPRAETEKALTRLKQLGADLRYLRLDEPLWFGHGFNSTATQRACHSSIADIARQTASAVAAARRIYPNIKIGDTEPVGLPTERGGSWASDVAAWLQAYEAAVGEPLAFFHIDVVWFQPDWVVQLKSASNAVRRAHVPLGIIYNGSPRDANDVEWTNSAITHFKYIEKTIGIVPDEASFQSWTDLPRAMLPESKAGTFTNVALQFLQWRKIPTDSPLPRSHP